jgi:hypothetical protein
MWSNRNGAGPDLKAQDPLTRLPEKRNLDDETEAPLWKITPLLTNSVLERLRVTAA